MRGLRAAARVQYRARHQHHRRGVQAGQYLRQVDGDAFGQACAQPQHLALAAGAGQAPALQAGGRARPVDECHRRPVPERGDDLDEPGDEVVAVQPPLVADQQLNGDHRAVQPGGPGAQRYRQVLDTGSKPSLPSTKSRTQRSYTPVPTSWARRRSSARRSRRDTCICEQPSPAAISRCLRSWKYWRTALRSAAGRAATSPGNTARSSGATVGSGSGSRAASGTPYSPSTTGISSDSAVRFWAARMARVASSWVMPRLVADLPAGRPVPG